MKKTKSNLTTLYIVRHGETEWNKKGLLQGHGDSALTEEGKNQAKETGAKLKLIHFDEVFSSDLLRAHKTAEIITLERNLVIKTTNMLRERNYGEFEGKVYDEYNAALKKLVKQYKKSEDQDLIFQKLHGVEPMEQSVTRLLTFLREIAVGNFGKTILIVAHGGIMRHMLIKLGFGTENTLPPGSILNAAFIKLESDGVDFFVKETKGITKISN